MSDGRPCTAGHHQTQVCAQKHWLRAGVQNFCGFAKCWTGLFFNFARCKPTSLRLCAGVWLSDTDIYETPSILPLNTYVKDRILSGISTKPALAIEDSLNSDTPLINTKPALAIGDSLTSRIMRHQPVISTVPHIYIYIYVYR